MDGPRGSLVIGLLFFISGQLAFIARALTGGIGFGLAGVVMTTLFVLAVMRVVVELFREGAAQGEAAPAQREPREAESRPAPYDETELERASRRQAEKDRARRRALRTEGAHVSDPVTPTAMQDPDSRVSVSHLDPEKRRPPHA